MVGTISSRSAIGAKVRVKAAIKVTVVGRLRVRGSGKIDYTIEVSEDFSRWTRAGVVKGGAEFVEADAGQQAARFCRARSAP